MKRCKGVLSIVYRLLIVLFFITTATIAKAQDLPCNDQDPFDNSCPLDSGVIVLVAAAGIFTAIHLYRKQKSPQA